MISLLQIVIKFVLLQPRMQKKLADLDMEVQTLQEKADVQSKCGKLKLEKCSTRTRQVYQQKQWQLRKIAKVYTSAGYSNRLSTFLAVRYQTTTDATTGTSNVMSKAVVLGGNMMCQQDPSIEDFRPTDVAVWNNNSARTVG